jgi:hypothetical protein
MAALGLTNPAYWGMRVKLTVNSWSGGLRSAGAHEKANE